MTATLTNEIIMITAKTLLKIFVEESAALSNIIVKLLMLH